MKVLGSLTILFILSALTSNVLAQTRTPGVSVGDTFKYTYTLNSNLGNSQNILPSFFQALMQEAQSFDWAQVTVTSVSGNEVTAKMVFQFKNGTQQTSTGVTDVATGEGNLTTFLIASNLGVNDQIYQDGATGTINETTTRTYPQGSRQVNHQSIINNYNVSQEELSGFNFTGPLQQSNTQDTYWDKQTGSLVEMSYQMTTRSALINADISVDVALINSSVYIVPEYPVWTFAVIAFAVSTIVTIKGSRIFKSTETSLP